MMTPPSLPDPGTLVGAKYRIERMIGSGGMGRVYLATDQLLGRSVAVKVLDPEMALRDENVRRFEHEAKMARHLEHPNTIQIFDFGALPNGLPFMVMEFLRGVDIDQIIRVEGALSIERTCRICTQILLSLANAHENGVIHRDLKPSNVIVGEFAGQHDFAKVLDFGLAKVIDNDRDAAGMHTVSGVLVGSPTYMPPERLKRERLGPYSDLFSFGVMMAEMLSGRPMYGALQPLQVLSNVLSPEPVPIPPEVLAGPAGKLIRRATNKAPNERFQSARAMIHAIEGIAGKPGEAVLREAGERQVVAGPILSPLETMRPTEGGVSPFRLPPSAAMIQPAPRDEYSTQPIAPIEPVPERGKFLDSPANIVLVGLLAFILFAIAVLAFLLLTG